MGQIDYNLVVLATMVAWSFQEEERQAESKNYSIPTAAADSNSMFHPQVVEVNYYWKVII